MLARIGRLACEGHYHVGRLEITAWIEESGRRLIGKRAKQVRGQSGGRLRQCPPDFEGIFVAIGAKACRGHYGARRQVIERWIEERGGQQLIEARQAFTGKPGLTPGEMSAILKLTFPARWRVSFALARHAAQFLRSHRNGGYTISPAPNGQWWIGTKKITAAELVERAIGKGFEPNLTGAPGATVG